MTVGARYYTDPACPWSWSAEPAVRKLMVEFGDNVSWTYVMGGLARDYTNTPDATAKRLAEWLDVAEAGGVPIAPRLWREGPIGSSSPACMAVEAAAEQGEDAAGRYLRAVRGGLMCFRRKLDTTEALVEEARRAGLDVERFRLDLSSNATVEAFGNDLEETRAPRRGLPRPEGGGGRRADIAPVGGVRRRTWRLCVARLRRAAGGGCRSGRRAGGRASA